MEASKKSQKMFSLVKLAEEDEDIPMHLNIKIKGYATVNYPNFLVKFLVKLIPSSYNKLFCRL